MDGLDFYVVQLRHLPDISARVVNLVQLMARYVYIQVSLALFLSLSLYIYI